MRRTSNALNSSTKAPAPRSIFGLAARSSSCSTDLSSSTQVWCTCHLGDRKQLTTSCWKSRIEPAPTRALGASRSGVTGPFQSGPTSQRGRLAQRWQRAITRTGASPHSANEVRERLVGLVDAVAAVLAGDGTREAALQIGSGLANLGYRSPEALGATLDVLSSAVLEELPAEELMITGPRLSLLLGGIAAGFDGRARHLLLDEQEASRAAVLAENRRAWDALRRQAALLDLA